MNTKNLTIVIIALAVIGLATYQFGLKKPNEKAASTSNGSLSVSEPMVLEGTKDAGQDVVMVQELKDGTYEATGKYVSPAGPETLGVTVTLKDGLIAEASVEPQAINKVSLKMQTMFKDGFKDQVIGKDITEVKLEKVSASSLSPKGFNDALQQIIEQAQG